MSPLRGLTNIMLCAEPENQRGQSHENSGHTESPTVTGAVANDGNNEEPRGGSQIDGPIKPTVHFSQRLILIWSELIADKCRDAWFDSASADRQQRQSDDQSGAIAFEKRQRSMAKAIKERDAENSPITSPKPVRKPAAQQRQKIDCCAEQVECLRRAV